MQIHSNFLAACIFITLEQEEEEEEMTTGSASLVVWVKRKGFAIERMQNAS